MYTYDPANRPTNVGGITYAGATPTYFLSDALGSVRQLTDNAGAITLAKNYQPYGTVMSSAGSGASMYGYTGEQTDSGTNLIYLRARYYTSGTGRFVTADSWPGDYQQPMSLNRWLYVNGNPINHVDPMGFFSCVFETTAVKKHILEKLGWASCEEGIEHVLSILEHNGGQASSIVAWAFREADLNEGIEVYFSDSGKPENPNGWRDNFSSSHRGHIKMDGNGLPEDLLMSAEEMAPNTLAYISLLSHEFWHATMQVAGTANLTQMEAEAFAVQAKILEELKGDQGVIDFLYEVSDDPAQYGYTNTIFKYAQACVAYLRVLGPAWGDYAAFERRNEVLEEYGK